MAVWARLDDVCVRYGNKIVMQNLSLDIVEGEITCIIGLSGAGKSTILRLLNGLKKPDSGRVFVKGQDITEMRERDLIDLRRTIGFAFQFSALFDSLSIGENVALPLREHTKMKDAEIRKMVADTLESVGLAHVEERFPAELSGGMVKRAGFARAVVTNPQAVLYDEPTTGLDPIITHVLTDTIVKTAGAPQRDGRRGVARPGKHLPDGGSYRDAVRGRDRRLWNRRRDSQVTESDRSAILARERSRADTDLTS